MSRTELPGSARQVTDPALQGADPKGLSPSRPPGPPGDRPPRDRPLESVPAIEARPTPIGVPARLFRLPVRVYYQDTDAGGVVFHGAYLNFLERARTEFLRSLGFDIGRLAADGVLFALHRLEVEFIKPCVLDEALVITAGIARLGRTSAQFVQTVERAENRTALRASLALVCVSSERFKPVAIPQAVRAALEPWVAAADPVSGVDEFV